MGPGVQSKIKINEVTFNNDTLIDEHEEMNVKMSLKIQKYSEWALHVVVGVLIILLSLKSSFIRTKALLFFFAICALCTLLTFVANIITIVACWNHKEIKANYFFFYLQMFSLLTSTILLWEAI